MPKRQDASSGGGGGTINPLMAGPLPGSSRGGTADKLVDHRDRGDGACCSHVTGCHDGPAALLSRSLRAGRWMAPADLIRNRVKSPWVYYFVASISLLLTTTLALGGSMFKFPDNMGSPVVKYTSLHCIFTPDNNTLTLNPMERVVETFSDIVLYTPEGPHDLGKCEQEWLTGAVAGGKDVVFPPPVVRVANFAEQGIEGITVTATVTELIDASSGLPPNVVTQTVETSAAGFASFPSLPLAASAAGSVFSVTFDIPGGESLSLQAAQLASGSTNLVTTVVEQPPASIDTGDTVTVVAKVANADTTPAAGVPVEGVLLALLPILTTGLPAVNTTDANGMVSFTFTVSAGHSQETVFRLDTSGGSVQTSKMMVNTAVEAVELVTPPAAVSRIGSALGSSRDDWRRGPLIVSTEDKPDTVVVCSVPRLEGKSVRIQTVAAATTHELLLNFIEGNYTFTELGLSVEPMIKGRMSWTGSTTTGADGCVHLNDFDFTDGSNGNYYIKFDIDGKFVSSGPHYLVNPSIPLFGNMRFLSGAGPFVSMWLVFSSLGAVYLVLMNPGHGLWARLLGVGYSISLLTLITFLSTSPDGVFYSGLGMAQIEYMPPCCSFEHNTAPENVLELLLLCCGSMVILVAVRYSLQALWSNEYRLDRGLDGTTFQRSLTCCKRACPGFVACIAVPVRVLRRVLGDSSSFHGDMLQAYYRLVRRLITRDRTKPHATSNSGRLRKALELYSADNRSFEFSVIEHGMQFLRSCWDTLSGLAVMLYALLVFWWLAPAVLRKRAKTEEQVENTGSCRGIAGYIVRSVAFFLRSLALVVVDLLRLLQSLGSVILGIRFTPRPAENNHKPFETASDFFFPPRLLMTFALSNFLTLIVGLFFAIGIDWAVQWGNSAMAEWVSTEEQMNMFLVWPPSKSRFNPYSRLTMNVFGLALIQLREVLTDSTYNLVFLDIVPPAIAGLAFLVWLGVLGGWIAMLFNFRRKVFRARQGIFDFDKRAVRITNVTKYMGYQAMHTLIAFFSIFVVAFVVILFIVLSIFVIPLQELEKQQLKEAFTPWGGFLLHFLVVYLSVHIVGAILVDFKNGVRSPPLFVIFDHFFSVVCLLMGMLTALKRLLIIVFSLVFSFWRLDLSWITIGDSGHGSYNALLLVTHIYNNPVAMVFSDLVFKEINARRHAKRLPLRPHEDWLSCPVPVCCCCCFATCCCGRCLLPGEDAFDASADTCISSKHAAAAAKALDVEAGSGSGTAKDGAKAASSRHRSARVRAAASLSPAQAKRLRRVQLSWRWWLAVTLYNNPSIRKYRRSRLTAVQVSARVMELAAHLVAPVTMRTSSFGARTVWAKQVIMLRDVYVVMYAKRSSRRPRMTLPLRDVIAVSPGGEESLHELALATTYKEVSLRFASKEERAQWQQAIEAVMADIAAKGEAFAGEAATAAGLPEGASVDAPVRARRDGGKSKRGGRGRLSTGGGADVGAGLEMKPLQV